jgi:AGCS family alanine or glycine:cation symporter
MEDSLMAMLTVFISSCICFILGLAIIACGVWQAGHTSTALVITSFNTVFGSIAGWVVVILSIAFGSGLIVSYGFVAQNVWGYLTGGRFALIGSLLYCSVSFLGALVNPHVLWLLGDIINAGMILINISALIILSNVIKSGLKAYAEKNKIKKDVNVT